MERIKQPSVAGTFYSADAEELKEQIYGFASNNRNSYEAATRAVIVPHAGYEYSGQIAYEGISQFSSAVKNIIIFAPAHKVSFQGLALSSYEAWATPLGNLEVNQDVNRKLAINFGAKIYDDAFLGEHSVEVQLPIIKFLYKDNVKIIPILVGNEAPKIITDIIQQYYENEEFAFIISSDLSHFLTNEEAQQMDAKSAVMIELGEMNEFKFEQACGAVGIFGLVDFVKNNGYSLIRIIMSNSSESTGDTNRVVGYGAWFLYEGSQNKFLKEYYSDLIIEIVKKSILAGFSQQELSINFPLVFAQNGACFVTLRKNGILRGCIGSLAPYRPLIADLVTNAQNAAFKDPRFKPVTFEEYNDLKVDVSILGNPEIMKFKDEQDLLEQIVPHRDGIILQEGQEYQALYLPSVWDEIPDKVQFLRSLKRKAGLPEDYFSSTLMAFRFETEFIEEQR